MKRIAQLLLVALVVVCCTANNTDVCLNPSNPSYNNIINFKQIDVTTTYVELPFHREVNVTSSNYNNCWTFEWDDLDIFQRTSTLFDDHFYGRLTGTLYDTCNHKVYEVEVYERCSQALVHVQSNQIESVTIDNLDLRGHARCGNQNYNIQFTTYPINLYSDCKPIAYEQDDEYFTDNNSQCTLRLRADSATNIVYTQNFGFKIILWDNCQLQFTFPNHKKAEVEYCYDKYFYQNCNCRQIVGCGGDTDARTRAATTLRTAAPVMPANNVV
eukprot:TRINITY_DN61_c0_g1_i1.p1 TRINITY_DN61_c0_g1~~TRINITY_DN61_c0_g1_i1.p1  ORF type:complete len:271 (+),score=92.90 TRINITY_DN61_c0_g1_i1:1236-2048(+)